MCANGDKELALTCRHFRAEAGLTRHGQAAGNLDRDKLPYLLLKLQECRSRNSKRSVVLSGRYQLNCLQRDSLTVSLTGQMQLQTACTEVVWAYLPVS